MFKDLDFNAASDLYQTMKQLLPIFEESFGEAGMECIVDALHLYVTNGAAAECCNFDVDFAHLFTLADCMGWLSWP